MQQSPDKQAESQFLAAYDQYADALYRHCFFRVYTSTRAEELVQETFTKTWDYLRQGNHIDNIRAFLYRVANNLIIDNSRKKSEESLEQILTQNPQWEPAGEDASDIEQRVLFKQVLQSMYDLPTETRQLLIYRFVDDLEPREIAEILNISPNYVSVKLTRAIQSLKKLHEEV